MLDFFFLKAFSPTKIIPFEAIVWTTGKSVNPQILSESVNKPISLVKKPPFSSATLESYTYTLQASLLVMKVTADLLCFTEGNIMLFDPSWADRFLSLKMSLFDLRILNRVSTLITALVYVCSIFNNIIAIILESWIFCLTLTQDNRNLLSTHGIIPASFLYKCWIISYTKDIIILSGEYENQC